MPRGGPRPGSGRKPGPQSRSRQQPVPGESANIGTSRSPLEYLMDLMNDVTADILRRDRAAQVLMPYCHPRTDAADSRVAPGKKEQADIQAKTAEIGTRWSDLVH